MNAYKEVKDIVAENINRYLVLRGLSQNDLATHLGVSRATVSYWCKGSTAPRMDKIEEISRYLNVSVYDLTHRPDAAKDEMIQKIFDRPEMRLLFHVASSCTPEEILTAVKIIEAIKK